MTQYTTYLLCWYIYNKVARIRNSLNKLLYNSFQIIKGGKFEPLGTRTS